VNGESASKLIQSATLVIFALTILSYGVTVLYQQAYYSFFNVNTAVLSLSIDPAGILLAAVVLIGVSLIVVSLYLYGHVLNFLFKKISSIKFPTSDVMSLLMLIFSLCLWLMNINPFDQLSSLELIEDTTSAARILCFLLGGTSILYFLLRVMVVVQYARAKEVAFWIANKEVIKRMRDRAGATTISKKGIITVAIGLGLIILPFFTYELGLHNAKQTVQFIQIIDGRAAPDTVGLVIGRSADGIILKDYLISENRFSDSFYITKDTNNSFKKYTIRN
jgi:hypothetical protein